LSSSAIHNDLPDNAVRVRLFGAVELQNNIGFVAENRSRASMPWLLLKYLLLNADREVSQEEAQETLWSHLEGGSESAARVRLRRLRESFAPLGLDGTKGLLLFYDNKYCFNPQYELITDEKLFRDLMVRIRMSDLDDPEGLNACFEALTLCRGRFMKFTDDYYWLRDHRRYYSSEFCDLALSTLERMRAVGDSKAANVLCRAAVEMIPREEEVHREIFRYMMEQKLEIDLMRYMTQLSHISFKGPEWLRNLEYKSI